MPLNSTRNVQPTNICENETKIFKCLRSQKRAPPSPSIDKDFIIKNTFATVFSLSEAANLLIPYKF